MLNSRQKEILELVIREFIRTAEPVASVTITQKYDIGCCSATVRNEMVRLEEMGYLEQPHSSAGRIPKDKAYRLFVDEIMKRKIGPPPETAAAAIESEYIYFQTHLERLMEKTARLLSHVTHYTSVMLAPRLRKSYFKYLKLVSVGPTTILLFVLTATGTVIHRTVELSKPIAPEDLERITNILNDRLQGKPLQNVESLLSGEMFQSVSSEFIENIRDITHDLNDRSKEVFLEGRTHLLNLTEFKDLDRIRVLMEVLEDEEAVAEILSETLSGRNINVFIGEENPVEEMKDCSLVTATYSINGQPVGTLGIIGPRRMPYEEIIPIVNFTAENVSNKLQGFDQL